MVQSPWEANSHTSSQEIHHPVWNLKVHCHVHKSLLLVPVLSQVHLFCTLPLYFPKIHYGILRFPPKIFCAFLICPLHAPRNKYAPFGIVRQLTDSDSGTLKLVSWMNSGSLKVNHFSYHSSDLLFIRGHLDPEYSFLLFEVMVYGQFKHFALVITSYVCFKSYVKK